MNDNILLKDEFDVLVPYITEMKGNPSSGAYFIKWSVKPIGLAQPMGCKRQSLR